MKTKLCVLIFLLAAALAQAQTNSLTALLQQGLFEEQANQNLDAAIADYQSLATQFDKDRQIAATAVFRLGECYRAQGKTNEAAAQYERILRDFSDQTTLATLSRQNLTGLGRLDGNAAGGIASSQPSSSPNPELTRELQLVKKLQAMPFSELIQDAPTLLTDATLINLINQYNQCDLDLLRLRVDHSSDNPDVKKILAIRDGMSEKIRERLEGLSQALTLDLASAGNIELTTIPSGGGDAPVPDDEDREIQRIQQMIQDSPDLINAPGENSSTPLRKAAFSGWLKVATYLLDHGADVNVGAALNAAATAGNRAMVELLLSRGANVNSVERGNTPLSIASDKNYPSVVEVLLANKADVNGPPGNAPLSSAAAMGYEKIVKMLLDAGANPNVEDSHGRTPLASAAGSGSPESVKLLLDAKADPNGGKLDEPLFCAINKQDATSVEMLLQAGANPNAVGGIDFSGDGIRSTADFLNQSSHLTPLWLAIYMKQLPMVQLLLKFKADPNDSRTDGQPLLFNALDQPDILAAMLDAGAKVDAMGFSSNVRVGNNPINLTPLDVAVMQNNVAAVETLLKHGANPNICDPIGSYTPLHWAANFLANRKIFELLLAYKAERNVRDESGQTPLDMLKEEAKADNLMTAAPEKKALARELADLLRQHGALDKLPDWDRITMSRPSANFSAPVFYKGTNDWNRFTLLETIFNYYTSSQTYPVTQGPGRRAMYTAVSMMPFPDLSRVIIVRPNHDSTNVVRISVNLLDTTNGIDFSKDVPLEFGDVVEIPERDHSLGEQAIWLTDNQTSPIAAYLTGKVQLIVRDQKVELTLNPRSETIGEVLNQTDAQKLLLSSSDLAHVKVSRLEPKTGKQQEWILDCSDHQSSSPPSTFQMRLAELNNPQSLINPQSSSDLRLRDGDVIEVPEKP